MVDEVTMELYNRIMRFDKSIRFAAVVNSRGHILNGGMREGIEPIEPLEKTPHLIARLTSIQKAEDLADFFGKPEYSVLVHEKITAIIFRQGTRLVLITTNRKFPLTRVATLCRLIAK